MLISIEGNLGSGKSYYLNKLKKDGFSVCQEVIEQWSFTWLMQSLYNKHTQTQNHTNKTIICERSNYTNNKILKEIMYENSLLTANEYQLETKYHELLKCKPDVIIYLHCDPQVCYDRIMARDGGNIHQIELGLIKNLHLKHEIVLDRMNCQIPIYKVNSQEDPNDVYQSIITILNSLNKK